LQSQHATLKGRYVIFQKLLEQSGFGFNDTDCLVTADPDVWNAYILHHPKAAEFRHKAFPLYHQLRIVFTGKFATGKHATSSNSVSTRINSVIDVDDKWIDVTPTDSSISSLSGGKSNMFSPVTTLSAKCGSAKDDKNTEVSKEPRKRKTQASAQEETLTLLKDLGTVLKSSMQKTADPSIEANKSFDNGSFHLSTLQVVKMKMFLANSENAKAFLSCADDVKDDLVKCVVEGNL